MMMTRHQGSYLLARQKFHVPMFRVRVIIQTELCLRSSFCRLRLCLCLQLTFASSIVSHGFNIRQGNLRILELSRDLVCKRHLLSAYDLYSCFTLARLSAALIC